MTTDRGRLVVLISGFGSNLQALIDAIRDDRLSADIVGVISSDADAFGLQRAEKNAIPSNICSLQAARAAGLSRDDFNQQLAQCVAAYQPDLVVLAGWRWILSAGFIAHFPHQILNLHPALPGTFPGLHAIRRAFDAAQAGDIDHTGVMVHEVTPEVDAGPVIATRRVEIHAHDTLDTLETRIHAAEHEALVEAVGVALAQRGTPPHAP